MKVLHINSVIVVNSGVMSVVMNYYRNIDRSKISLDFLYFMKSKQNYDTYEEEINKLGGVVFFINNFKNVIQFNKKLKLILSNNKYEIIHIHDPFVLPFINKTLRDCGIANIIVHSHATTWSDKLLSSIRNSIVCWNIKKLVDYPFACSIAAGKFLFGDKAKIFIMNNAVNVDRFKYSPVIREKVRNELGINGKLVFGHVGAFCNQKNHIFLINVFKEIFKKQPGAMLLLIGDGELRGKIEDIVKELQLDNNVIFLGKRNNVEDYYQAMDCFILPSLYEGLPMVGVEAQCSGLPIVFSDSITREVGGKYSKFISLKKDIKYWAHICLMLAKQEKNGRNEGAFDVTEMGFNIINEAKKLEAKYIEIVNKKGKKCAN